MRIVTAVVLSVFAVLGNVLLAPAVEIFSAKIDFIFILIVGLSFFSGLTAAPFAGLYMGIAVDMLTQGGTFINTGLYFGIGVLCALAGQLFRKQRSLPVFLLSTFVAVALKFFVLMFLLYILRIENHISVMTFVRGLPSAVYTTAIAAGMYFFFQWLFSWEFMTPGAEEDY